MFGLDGVAYTIDLSTENAAALRESLASFVASARRTGSRKRPGPKRGKPAPASAQAAMDRGRTQTIREWARNQGPPESRIGGAFRLTS
ncbi:Lsr2 dimerization domain-containing protein [Saccharopolyspora soli]|uniref:Lsr2 dimerization domain-containing protein n=1 Tax=Saccharopolyspora soli TaxID=2926618 RepID=UPI003556A1F9